jgi:predicted nicotinamide N-methyase
MTIAPDLVEEVVPVGGQEVLLLRPRDYDAMLTEEAFEHEELLPYWAQLWPSGNLLAQVLAARQWRGRRILELGCGLGLASIVAARAGARVTATDWSEASVAATADNAARNGVELETLVADWEHPDELVARAPWDLVIGADILYERRKADTLLDLLPRLTREVILADSHRVTAEPFFDAAVGWERERLRSTSEPLVTVHRLTRRWDPERP